MEDTLNQKISELLSSPDLLNNVKSILSGLNKSEKTNDVIISDNNPSDEISEIVQTVSQNGILNSITKFLSENQNERIALLTALRPFLSSEKQETVDFIIQILKAVNIFLSVNMLS